ncbi:MAG: hypothetical protein DSY60_00050 [Persephonella sp.]|nr:MAG: hypothetical protein DSY60_00050 [Persephonella sp.]
MLKDNKLALHNSYMFFKRNILILLTSVAVITTFSYISPILSYFLLMVLIGSVIFFLRDNELLDDIRTKKNLTLDILRSYLKYGLIFALLYFLLEIIISILVFFVGVILTFLFLSTSYGGQFNSFSFGLVFMFSIVIATVIVMLFLSPFYLLLPIYINLILSSTYPLEILKINIKLFSKDFWKEVLSMLKSKYFIITSLIWSTFSILIFFVVLGISFIVKELFLFIFTYIPIFPFINFIFTDMLSLFMLFVAILYLFVYLVYISHYIKLNTH